MLTEVRAGRGTYTFHLSGMRGGGQAIIYRADGPAGSVAVKIARDPRDNPWLARERDALLALQSAGATWVVPILDHGDAPDGRIFLVLPWFEHTLSDWLDADPPLGARLLAMTQVCEAVIRLHRSAEDLSIVRLHRDIKPSNFLVRAEPGLQVVLADLGGVKEGDLLSHGQQTAMHTPHFAPPEQELPIDRPLDPSADVHALGVTLYWAIVGDVPRAVYLRRKLYADEVQQLLALHRKRQPTEAAEYRRLRTLPLGALFDLSAARALLETDRSRFRQHLVDLLIEESEDPAGAAEQLCSLLLPPLEHALSPDPERRSADARPLLAACRRGMALLGIAPGSAAGPAPAQASHRSSSTRPAPAQASHRSSPASPAPAQSDLETLIQHPGRGPLPRWRPWELALAGLLGLGLVALVALRGTVSTQEVAPESPPADGPTPELSRGPEAGELAATGPSASRAVEGASAESESAAEESSAESAESESAESESAESESAESESAAARPAAARPAAGQPAAPPPPDLAAPRLFLRPGGDGAATLVIGGEAHPDKYSLSLSEPLSVTLVLDGSQLCTLSASRTPAGAERWEVSVGDQRIQAEPGQTVVARYTHRCTVTLSLK